MKIGTYYYPEQWPVGQWERDFDRMAAIGMQIVHMGEFAWYDLEPAAGDIRLDWLGRCVDMAAARKMEVILCTPTAAPPVWLGVDHPETLPVDKHGTAARFGSRRHYCPTSPAMREASTRIVTALAERFGDHPAVIGWQIDNEIGGAFDQSDNTHNAFRAWLGRKYGTIEQLNAAWACQFWNTYYRSFDEIKMPVSRDPAYGNPTHHLDGSRFWSWAWADFIQLQSDILRPLVGGRWITTNFMPLFPDIDPGDTRDALSLWSWDTYPAGGFGREHKNEHFRLADPAGMQLVHDQMRSYNGRWALMEVQPGQINWSGIPMLPYPGAIRLWLWTALAHGAEFCTVYRYRQPRFGIEQWHDGLVRNDGVTLSPGGKQFQQVAGEAKRVAAALAAGGEDPYAPRGGGDAHAGTGPGSGSAAKTGAAGSASAGSTGAGVGGSGVGGSGVGGSGVGGTGDGGSGVGESGVGGTGAGGAGQLRSVAAPGEAAQVSAAADASDGKPPSPRVGLLLDFDQLWHFATLPQAKSWSQPELLKSWHCAASRLGLEVVILHPNQPWPAGLGVVVAPGVQLVDDALVGQMDDYAAGGGQLILTCRTGLMDRNGHFFEGPTGQPILRLIGASIEAYDSMPEATFGHVEMEGRKYPWSVWGDLLFGDEGTKEVAYYTDMFYSGATAITHRKHGGGGVTYCGVFGQQALHNALMERVVKAAGLPHVVLPDRTRIVRRGGVTIALNYNDQPVRMPVPAGVHFIIGGHTLPPAGVAVWEG